MIREKRKEVKEGKEVKEVKDEESKATPVAKPACGGIRKAPALESSHRLGGGIDERGDVGF